MYSTYDHKNALETEKVFDTTYAETRLKQFSGLRLLFHVTANVCQRQSWHHLMICLVRWNVSVTFPEIEL